MSENSKNCENPEKLNYFQKVWRFRRYLIIEPYFFFYVMASVFNAIAIVSFPLDKACRVNLLYAKQVCAATLDKSYYNVNCDAFDFKNTTDFTATIEERNFTTLSIGFNYTVCKAEKGAQKLAANISGKRAPIAAIFPLIILLFAGGWADRYNKRKACMIVPLIGESLMFLCLLVSAIFFDTITMEFGAYTEAIVPAIFGGLTLSLMAIDSYMSISTPAEDRIFRFGIFGMFSTAIIFIGQPISGLLFQYLGYVISFAMGLGFNIVALIYVIFVIKELKPLSKPQEAIASISATVSQQKPTDNIRNEFTNVDNVQFTNVDNVPKAKNIQNEVNPHNIEKSSKSKVFWLKDFFDPTLVLDYIRFPCIKRPNNGRLILILLIFSYICIVGPVSGETDFWNRFTFLQLNWNGNDYSIYSTFSSALALVGTFIGTTIFSKLCKFSDALLGIISAITTALSRVLFAFAKDSITFYAGGVADMFVSLRAIAIKTIGSSIVQEGELSKMFSIFGICQPIVQIIFTPIYSYIYESTVNTFPGTFFLFSEIFAITNILVFIFCYIVVKSKKQSDDNATTTTTVTANNGDCEITSL
uniref:Major facilitator superfamily (MFS) profile domain-containing protein n=1 Tax=Glossina brevipalpis TaxID=37001 RepID=A0A1A9WT06_9MUSC